jgi:uncharacterized membrane protein YoaK (UPF0700 family)
MKSRLAGFQSSWVLPAVLSTTAGAVDVIGFLSLGGLFTAHISGNLCMLAAHYTTGSFSHAGPLLSVPVFIAVLGLVMLVFGRIGKASDASRPALLILHAALLAACLGIGAGFGPFGDPDRPMAVLVGMFAVAAMATQNALVRVSLKDAPATAVMSTNITVLAIDLATLARRPGDPDALARARRRLGMTLPCVVGFVGGCAAGAVLENTVGIWALALPVVLAAIAVPLGEMWNDGRASFESNSGKCHNDQRACAQASLRTCTMAIER